MSLTALVIIGIVGAVFLAASVVFDGLFDFASDDPILATLAFFAAIFGFTGALAKSAMTDPPFALYIGVAGAVAGFASAAFFLLYKGLRRSLEKENSYVHDVEDLVGSQVAIEWWNGNRGEVQSPWHGGTRRSLNAVSEEDLKSSSIAYITGFKSNDLVELSSTPPSTTQN